MSVADLHDLELVWPNPDPTDIIVTGTFDQWSSSIHLAKGDVGFSGTVKVPWGEKVAYKFIVDGLWQCRDDRPQEDDGHGNVNNVAQIPAKPVSSIVQEQLARLSIPPEVPSEGYNDTEMMVTAVEWMPTAEPAVAVSLPLPAPEVDMEASQPGAAPPADAPVNEPTLDTSADAKEIVTSTVSLEVPPPAQSPGPTSSLDVSSPPLVPIVPVNDDSTSPPLEPQINGNGEAHPPNSFATIQFSKGEPGAIPSPAPPAAVEPETAKEAVVTPSESGAAESAQVHGDAAPVPVPVSVPETSTKEPKTDGETAANGHRQEALAPPSTSISTLSLKPSTATHKKRRSLFARIRHIFDKDKDKEKVKEKIKEKSQA